MKQYKVDNISICGYSHKLINKECQDSSISWQGYGYSAGIVCDGHGGEKYIRSAIGSSIACQVGRQAIDDFMQHIMAKNKLFSRCLLTSRNYDKLFCQLEKNIIQSWRERIEQHFLQNPLGNDARWESLSDSNKQALNKNYVKAYGSTFIASVLTEDFCFILKLGDGDANIVFKNGNIEQPQELFDEQLQFNLTTSLCNSDADVEFKHCLCSNTHHNYIKSVVMTTDGVINCYNTNEAYHALITNIVDAYKEEETQHAHDELEECLNTLSQKGSGDDLSVAIIY